MGPAIRVRRGSGLVSAETLTAAAPVQPDREPGCSWLVVENNGVPHGVQEGALTTAVGQAGECVAAVGRDRRARDIDGAGVAAS